MKRDLRAKTCCFSGHRDISSEIQQRLASQLEQTIERLICSGICFFGTGGARGFDTLAALAIIKLRIRYPHVRLILVLPCINQTRGWQSTDIELYQTVIDRADKIVYTSLEYTRDCMFRRNRHLVGHSSVCVCYCVRHGGGTAYTVAYAKASGLRIINLAET